MLARSIDEQDYDLVSELLLSYSLMNEAWSTSSIFAFHILTKIEDEIGFVPSLSIQMKIPEKLAMEDRKNICLALHIIPFVMGLLCSVILQYNRNPPKKLFQRKSHKEEVK